MENLSTTSPANGLANMPENDIPSLNTPKKVGKKKQAKFTSQEAMAYGTQFPGFREKTQSYLLKTNPKGPGQLAQNAIERANEEINSGNYAAAANYLKAAGNTAGKAGNTAISQALVDARARLAGLTAGGGPAGAMPEDGEDENMLGPADPLGYVSRYGEAMRALGGEFNAAQIEDAALRSQYDPLIREAQRSQYYDRQRALGNLSERGLGFSPGLGALAAKSASGPGAQEAMRQAALKAAGQRAIIANLLSSIELNRADLQESDIANYISQTNALKSGWGV